MIRVTITSIAVLGALSLAIGCGAKDSHKHGEEHGEEGHDDHGDEGHDDHGDEGHDDHGEEKGHDEHEEGIVELSPEAAARVRIRTAPVESRRLSGLISTTGRVGFNEDKLTHISPRVSGRVNSVRANLGDRVKAWQSLAVIDSIGLGRAKSAFLRARAQLELTKATLRREEDLLKDKITSEQSVLEARAAHQRANATFQSARQELRLLGVSSKQIKKVRYDDPSAALIWLTTPSAGTVVEKHVTRGEVVSPGRNLFTIADLTHLWIWIDIYEKDLARVHLEDDVEVMVDAFPGRSFKGKVAYIRDQVDHDTRTARARIDVPNADRALRAGMFATVMVSDPHAADGGTSAKSLVVPASAIQRDGTEHVAFVAEGERRYERRELTLGLQTAAYVEVTKGLAEGESVVVEGTFILKSEAAKESMGGGHSH